MLSDTLKRASFGYSKTLLPPKHYPTGNANRADTLVREPRGRKT